MANEEDPRKLLEPLESERWEEVRDALDVLDAALTRDDPGVKKLLPELEGHLWGLSRHAKWEVRAAVARNARYLRQEYTLALLARLIADDNASVQRAARTSLTRRTPPARSDLLREEHGIILDAHRVQLSQAFAKFLQNSLDAYGPNGVRGRRVAIETKREGDACVIMTFSDRAGGMSEEVLRNAFHLGKSKKTGGFGYGLLL